MTQMIRCRRLLRLRSIALRHLQIVAGLAAVLIIGWPEVRPTAQGTDAAVKFWPQWRGPHGTGVSRIRQSAARMERDEKRPLEGRDSRPRIRVAGRLGRPAVRADRGPGRRDRRSAACAARRRAAARRPPVRRRWRSIARPDERSGNGSRAEEEPHEAGAPREQHLGLELRGHRRRAPSSPTSNRAACTPTTWTASCSGRRISATSACGTSSARDRRPRCYRKHARHRLGPLDGSVVRRRARQARPARNCGACRGRKSIPGPRRSWSR